MTNIIISLIAIMLFTEVVSYAAHDETHNEQKAVDTVNINAQKGEVVIIVHGIVCSFCSQGVAKKLSKLPFIDSSKYTNGIKVEIDKQKVTIAVKSGSNFDIDKVFKSIRSGGYEPVVAYKNLGNETVTIHPDGRETK